jgi:molecular chaperone GrpE (heat shock protein)
VSRTSPGVDPWVEVVRFLSTVSCGVEAGKLIAKARAAERQQHTAQSSRAHELSLIEASIGERGKTDCSTPTFIRVRNIIERMEKAEAEVASLTQQLAERISSTRLADMLAEMQTQRVRAEKAEQQIETLRQAAKSVLESTDPVDVFAGLAQLRLAAHLTGEAASEPRP